MTESYVYCEGFEKITDRLDFVAYNPEKIKFFNMLKSKGAIPLESCDIDIIEEAIEPKQYPETEFNYLGLEGIESNTGVTNFEKLTGKEIYSNCQVFMKNDIVFGRLRPYLNKVHLVEIESGIGSTELYVIRAKDANLRKYLFYYLLSNLTLKQTKWALTGSSLPRLTDTDFRNLLIIVPKNIEYVVLHMEQLDSQINDLKINIRNEYNKIFSLFVEKNQVSLPKLVNWFVSYSVNKRLDFIWYNPEILSFLNQINKKNSVTLGSIIEDEIAYGINDYGREQGKIPFINIENLKLDGKIHSDNIRYVDYCPKDKILLRNDILISRSRGAGVSGLITEKEEGFTYGSYVLRLRLKNCIKMSPLYLIFYLNSPLGQIQIRRLETGSTGCNINPEQIKQIQILAEPTLISEATKLIKMHLDSIKKYEERINELINKRNEFFEELVLR